MIVDSGASVTVVGEHMLKAINTQESRSGVECEVAEGSKIPNLGQKEFSAWTDDGAQRKMKVQVTEVNKALLSVPRIVQAGNRVVFDPEGRFIEDITTGEWIDIKEKNGLYALTMWVPKDQECPF